jgi:hypothetical protein
MKRNELDTLEARVQKRIELDNLEARVRKLEEKNFAELPTYKLNHDSKGLIVVYTLYQKDNEKLEYVPLITVPFGQEVKLRKIKNILES